MRVFESTQAGVDSLAIVLICFLAGLVPFSGLYLVQRAFYALEETKTLFWLFLATVAGAHLRHGNRLDPVIYM